MDKHCSNETISEDLGEEVKSTQPVIIHNQEVCAEDRFEVENTILRMFALARPQLQDAA